LPRDRAERVAKSRRYLLYPQLTAARPRRDSLGISVPGPYTDGLVAEGIRHLPVSSLTRRMNPLADVMVTAVLSRILRRERPNVLRIDAVFTAVHGSDA
jgi:hypothetical protein